MAEAGALSVEALVLLLTRRRARLPFEIGAFVALEACERLVAQGPRVIEAGDVLIDEEGHVTVSASGAQAASGEAARSVAQVLARLLVAAGHGVPPVMLELVDKAPGGHGWDLSRLRDELEATLVPLNRAAARRVLARVLRDGRRAEQEGGVIATPSPPQPSPGHVPQDVDAALDAFLDDDLDDLPTKEIDPGALARLRTEEAGAVPVAPGMLEAVEPLAPDRELGEAVAQREPPSALAPPKAQRRRVLAVVLTVGLLVGIVAILWAMKDGRDLAEAPAPDEASAIDPSVAGTHGRLFVEVDPPDAQVLLLVGRGPVTVPDLAVGVAHEFVAIAEGSLPSRAVVPSGGAWHREGEGAPRYELAMQVGEPSRHARELDIGASKLPPDRGTPSGERGAVRVITNPPGASVYRMVGHGPRVVVEGLDPGEAQQILVYHEARKPERRTLAPAEWAVEGSRTTAALRVELAP
jgi:hypothetical protein